MTTPEPERWPGVIAAFRAEYPRHPTPSPWNGSWPCQGVPEAFDAHVARTEAQAREHRAAVVATVKRLGVPSRLGAVHWADIVAAIEPPMGDRKVRRLWYEAQKRGEV
jgi:hypothetical protein